MRRSDRKGIIVFISIVIVIFFGGYKFFGWIGTLITFLFLIAIIIGFIVLLISSERKEEKKKRDEEEQMRQHMIKFKIEQEISRKRRIEEGMKEDMKILSLWGVQSVEELEKITDQRILLDVVKRAPKRWSVSVRLGSVEKLTDQRFLADIALQAVTSKDWDDRSVGLASIRKLINPDQNLLANIILNDAYDNSDESYAALENLTDQYLLEQIARKLCIKPGRASTTGEAVLKKLSNMRISHEIRQAQAEVQGRRGIDMEKVNNAPSCTSYENATNEQKKCDHSLYDCDSWGIGRCDSCGGTEVRYCCKKCGYVFDRHMCN